MSENVITSNDVAPVKVPKSFNDLKKDQLIAAADYFGTDNTGNAKAIVADLVESGVTFEQYLTAFFPDEKKEDKPETFELPEPTDVEDWPDADEGGAEVSETPELVTAAPTPE